LKISDQFGYCFLLDSSLLRWFTRVLVRDLAMVACTWKLYYREYEVTYSIYILVYIIVLCRLSPIWTTT